MKNNENIVDFHAHILPGADHGSDSIETSLWQINSARSAGVNRIIATPHFYPHRHSVKSFIERRNKAYNILVPHLTSDVEIRLGAEALICTGFENLPDLDLLFVEGTKTILIELPYGNFDDGFCRSVAAMKKQGIDVVLAHADRYSVTNVEKMIRSGARLQINAKSLLGLVKRREVYTWLNSGKVAFIGSDIHGKDKSAYRNFVKGISKIEKTEDIIRQNSDDVWNKLNSR